MNKYLSGFVGVLIWVIMLASPINAAAEAENRWDVLKESFFAGRSVEADAAWIRLDAPKRAESGAQVPLSFSIDHPMTPDQYIKSVIVLVGVNPVPLVGIFHFTPASGKAEIATRIRLETDSYIHVVAEDNRGKLFMNAIPVRAAGGCGGTVDGDEQTVRASAGKMKLSSEAAVGSGQLNQGKLLIKHPMFTGLQRDLISQGFRPAFFVNKAVVKYRGQTVLDADLAIGMSEDPNIRFNYVADGPGKLEVEIQDNEGGKFNTSLEVAGAGRS